MNTRVVQFRDKSDIRPLPPIPDELVAEMDRLGDKINAPDLTMFDKLREVYAFMDRYNAFVATFAVCQKGCAHCCRIDVSVSRLEAEYITACGGPVLDQGTSVTAGHASACPFLRADNSCSVYLHRPFNCRTFHTLDDPKYCADGKVDHQIYGSSSTGYGVAVFAAIARWLKAMHAAHGMPYRDIRDWFPERKKSLLNRVIDRVK